MLASKTLHTRSLACHLSQLGILWQGTEQQSGPFRSHSLALLNMASRSQQPVFTRWDKSKSKVLLTEHLENGVLSLDEEVVSAEAAWSYYSNQDVFIREKILFGQFNEALERQRNAIKKRRWHVGDQMAALEHDTCFMSRSTHDRRGKKKFYGTSAHESLKDDIKADNHTRLGMACLQGSREEHAEWRPDHFKRRVKQEVLTQKFFHHMEVKRAAKKAQAKSAVKSEVEAVARATERAARTAFETFDYCDVCQESDPDDEVNDDEAAELPDPGAANSRRRRRSS